MIESQWRSDAVVWHFLVCVAHSGHLKLRYLCWSLFDLINSVEAVYGSFHRNDTFHVPLLRLVVEAID